MSVSDMMDSPLTYVVLAVILVLVIGLPIALRVWALRQKDAEHPRDDRHLG